MLAIGAAFFLSCSMLSISIENSLLNIMAIYFIVTLLSISLGKYLVAYKGQTQTTILRMLLGNATGLVIGALLLFTLLFNIPQLTGFIGVVILASVMSFFILGTLGPLFSDRHKASII
ncbi:MAG: hypothetical protein ACI8XW_003873 [Gammaproteobacteria bacterium]|jgi:hypothetical protein